MNHPKPVLLIGLGNSLYSDDGAGPRAAQRAALLVNREKVDVVESSAAGFRLLDLMAGRRAVIIVDALVTGHVCAGEIVRIDFRGSPEACGDGAAVAGEHQMSLDDLLVRGKTMGLEMPEVVEIYGIEALDLSPGERLSPPVEAALPAAAGLVARRASYWARQW